MTDFAIEDSARPTEHHHHLGLDEVRAIERRVLARLHAKRHGRDLNQIEDESLTFGQRVADKVADTMGSWRFIIVQSFALAVWISLNMIGWSQQWDPYPFILLNLMLSFQAAYAAPIIMMSQNRQEARDRMRAELDLQTDLKAETLIEELHGNMEELRIRRWVELLEIQQRQVEMLTSLVERMITDDGEPTTTGASDADLRAAPECPER